jgi:hypothetical protein
LQGRSTQMNEPIEMKMLPTNIFVANQVH